MFLIDNIRGFLGGGYPLFAFEIDSLNKSKDILVKFNIDSGSRRYGIHPK